MAQEARKIVEDYINAWMKNDEDRLRELLADDGRFHGHPEGIPPDKDGEIKMSRIFHDAFPDLSPRFGPWVEQEDRVAVRVVGTGTHEGELMGFAPTNTKVEVSALVLVQLRDGQVVEDYTEFDALGLLTQIGAVPEMDLVSS